MNFKAALDALDAATREIERERCAKIAENPGFIECRDTEWDEGVNFAKRFIAAAIRRAPEEPGNVVASFGAVSYTADGNEA